MWWTSLMTLGVWIGLAGTALGIGGNLHQPSIAIPTDPKTKAPDPIAKKMADVLWSHRKDFTGGSFINAHSVLYFAGGTRGVNALLRDLAKIKGATIQVRLSREAGVTQWMFPSNNAPADQPGDCKIDHLGWGHAHVLTFTIYLGGGRIDPDKLELLAVEGR